MQNSSEAVYKDRALPQYTTARQQQDYKGYGIQGVAMHQRVSTSEAASIPVQQYFMPAAHLSTRGAMAHRKPNGDIDMRRGQGDLRPTTVAHPHPLISVAGSVTNASFTQTDREGELSRCPHRANASGYMPQQRDNGVTLVAQIVEKQLLDDGRQFKQRRDPMYQQVNGIQSSSKPPDTSKVNIPDVIVIEDDSPPSSVKTDSESQPADAAPTREHTASEGFVGKRKSEPSVNPISKVMEGASGEKVVPAMQAQPPPAHSVPPSASANTFLLETAVALSLQADTPKTLEKQIAQQIGTEKQSSAVSHVSNSLDPTRNIFSVFTSSSSVASQSSTQSKADYSESEQPLALTVKPSSTTTKSNYKKKRWNINALKSGSGAENSSQVGHTNEIKMAANVYKAPGVDGGSLSSAQLTSKLDLPSTQSSQRQASKSPEVPLKPIKPKQQWAHSRKLKEVEALQKDAEWQAGPSERSSVRQSKSLATAIIKSVIEDEEITSGKYKSSVGEKHATCSSSCSSNCDCSSRGLSSVLQYLPTNITELNLWRNDITTLNQSDFSSNQLTSLQFDMFVGLDNLQDLPHAITESSKAKNPSDTTGAVAMHGGGGLYRGSSPLVHLRAVTASGKMIGSALGTVVDPNIYPFERAANAPNVPGTFVDELGLETCVLSIHFWKSVTICIQGSAFLERTDKIFPSLKKKVEGSLKSKFRNGDPTPSDAAGNKDSDTRSNSTTTLKGKTLLPSNVEDTSSEINDRSDETPVKAPIGTPKKNRLRKAVENLISPFRTPTQSIDSPLNLSNTVLDAENPTPSNHVKDSSTQCDDFCLFS
ncbi:hypothetical protein Bbelb_109250 [Branchiostoma belcheri]|nr:hypothetical protein Bbelb_109250 [Branchiostoma belcheri]